MISSYFSPFYITSLIIFIITTLFFIGIGGSINAYIKKFLGDDESINDGFGSINPFVHMDFIFFLLLLTPLKIIIRKTQPFSYNWISGPKGIIQRIIYLIGPSFFHIILASTILFFSVKFFGLQFFTLTLKNQFEPSAELIKLTKNIFFNYSSIKIILILFLIYSITVNLFLSIIDFLINITSYIIDNYINPKYSSLMVTVFTLIFIAQIFFVFSSTITYYCWKLISFPLTFI